MTMLPGLDLTGVRQVVEIWLVDELSLTRTNGVVDDVLDPATGALTPGPEPVVWTGLGAVQSLNGGDLDLDPDTARIVAESGATHRVLVSLAAPAPGRYDDVFRVTASRSPSASAGLADTRYVVRRIPDVSSFDVVQIYYVTKVAAAVGTTPPDPEPVAYGAGPYGIGPYGDPA